MEKAVDNYPHALKFVPDCYKTQTMCGKAANIYHSTIQFLPECYNAQEMSDKAVNRYFLHLYIFLICIKLKKCVTVLFLKILL